VPCRRTRALRSTLLELGASPEFSSFASARSRPFSDPAPSRRNRAVPVRRAGLPLVGFLLPRTLSTSGAPSPPRATLAGARVGRGLPHPRRCRPQGSCPSRRFRQHAARSRLLDPAVRRGPRRFAAFFHAARVPGASLQSFPFPRSRTRSRGPPASLRVRVRPPPLQLPKDLHDRFRQLRASSSPHEPTRRWTRDRGAGTVVPRDR